ncbi:hypothetical protein PGB90_006863 [Kerria lacca]
MKAFYERPFVKLNGTYTDTKSTSKSRISFYHFDDEINILVEFNNRRSSKTFCNFYHYLGDGITSTKSTFKYRGENEF